MLNGDGNENGKNIGVISKKTTFHGRTDGWSCDGNSM